ncbi:Uncharacterised protein [Delftia tsuruhatensis]|uniref:hypothetical protein n=1 Tax=Delftia tsuruhatensis TaxID=180282 RepID=UPI001E6A751B|nr:hypothetical protein [Delftia tsuruhatensis]CAB5658160.1 Uncharacterised protein [Delftia tsuruhatensis]CAC9679366.1 Uncharacterised protein [Delftia tsuruhatensis]
MPQTSYEGPRHGDYVRYVDELLRSSPLYRSAAQGWLAQGRSDFTDAVATPGAQARSVAERVREQVQAAAEKARAAAQQASGQAAADRQAPAGDRHGGKADRGRQAARAQVRAATTAKAGGKTGFKLGPGQWLALVIGLILAVAIPGMGPIILLLTVINALFKGFRAGLRSPR